MFRKEIIALQQRDLRTSYPKKNNKINANCFRFLYGKKNTRNSMRERKKTFCIYNFRDNINYPIYNIYHLFN